MKKQWSAAMGEALLRKLSALKASADTAEAAHNALKRQQEEFKAYVRSVRLVRNLACMEQMYACLSTLYDAKDFELKTAPVNSEGKAEDRASIVFHRDCAAKAFWFRFINFALPKIGRGKATKSKPVIDAPVKDMAAKLAAFLKEYKLNGAEKKFLRAAIK